MRKWETNCTNRPIVPLFKVTVIAHINPSTHQPHTVEKTQVTVKWWRICVFQVVNSETEKWQRLRPQPLIRPMLTWNKRSTPRENQHVTWKGTAFQLPTVIFKRDVRSRGSMSSLHSHNPLFATATWFTELDLLSASMDHSSPTCLQRRRTWPSMQLPKLVRQWSQQMWEESTLVKREVLKFGGHQKKHNTTPSSQWLENRENNMLQMIKVTDEPFMYFSPASVVSKGEKLYNADKKHSWMYTKRHTKYIHQSQAALFPVIMLV